MQTLHSHRYPDIPFPAKVTYTKSSKKATKTYKCAVTVKNPGVRLVAAPTVVVNEKVNVVEKTWPASATVTYKSSDDAIATVDATTGEVTGVKAGKATITATMECGTKTVEKKTEVSVKTYELQSVTQKEASVLEAVITGDTKSVKPADIKITNIASNADILVKACDVDRKDSTKLLISTYRDMVDGKEYKVVIDGVEKTFTATDGKVADVGLEKTTVVAGELTEIKAVTYDASGVILGRYPASVSGKVTTNITVVNGYTSDSKIFIYNVGDTATATVTWHSGVRDANGMEINNIEKKDIVITAVKEEEVITDGWAVKIGNKDSSFKYVKETKLAVGDDNKSAYIQLVNSTSTGSVPTNDLTDYTVESSDLNSLIVSFEAPADVALGEVKLEPKKAGTVYLIIKKNDVVVATLPVEILAQRQVSGIVIDTKSVTLSKSVEEAVTIKVDVKDQHGEDLKKNIPGNSVNVEVSSYTDTAGKTITTGIPASFTGLANITSDVKIITFNVIDSANVGTYTVKFSDVTGRFVQTCAVKVVEKPASDKVTSRGYNLGMPTTTVDTTITEITTDAELKLTAIAYKTENGINAEIITSGAIKVSLVDSYNRPVSAAFYGAYGVEGNGTSSSSNLIDVDSATIDGKITLTLANTTGSLKLPAGTYTLVVEAADGYKMDTLRRQIVVKDSQAAVVCAIKRVSGTSLRNGLDDKGCMDFYYEGLPSNIVSVTYYALDGTTIIADLPASGSVYVNFAMVKVKVGTKFAWEKVDIKTTFTKAD